MALMWAEQSADYLKNNVQLEKLSRLAQFQK